MTEWTAPEWTIGDRIRKAREEAGLSQTALGEAAGVSKNTVSNVENGATVASRGTLEAIARVTGAPVDWLLSGESH